MSDNTLAVQSREGVGRGPARRMRKSGRIPAVIYGASGTRSLSVDEKEFRRLMRKLHGGASIIDVVDDEGGKTSSILQEISRDPVTDEFVHIDLQEVSANQEINVTVPIHTVGEAAGVKNDNGILDVALHEIEVRCFPRNLPESITVDVSELQTGEAIHIADMPKIEGVSYTGDPVTAVIMCAAGKTVAEEDEAPAEAAEGEKGEASSEGGDDNKADGDDAK